MHLAHPCHAAADHAAAVLLLLLGQVAAGKASTIIVLHPEGASSQASAEAIKTAIVMGLTALGPPPEQRIVVTGGRGQQKVNKRKQQHMTVAPDSLKQQSLPAPCNPQQSLTACYWPAWL